MIESPISKKIIFLTFIFSFFVCSLIFINNYFDERTKIVFCDVGQGDAAYIRIKNKIDILIDAGPDRKVLNCLGKHMPFWDRKIELAILSHPNSDHYNGFFYIIDRYQLDNFMTVNAVITTKTYKQLVSKIYGKKIPYQFMEAGDIFQVLNDDFIFYWPPAGFKSYQDNDYSLVFLFQENNFRALFTGDASPRVLNEIASSPAKRGPRNDISHINILKIPHHGSKNGLTKNFLDLADPMFAVISAGKNNSYGHPSSKVLEMLKAKNIYTERSRSIKIKRTDINGDIVFKLRE